MPLGWLSNAARQCADFMALAFADPERNLPLRKGMGRSRNSKREPQRSPFHYSFSPSDRPT